MDRQTAIMFQGSWAKRKGGVGGGEVGLSWKGLGRSSVFFALSADPRLDPPYSRLKRRKEGKEERKREGWGAEEGGAKGECRW